VTSADFGENGSFAEITQTAVSSDAASGFAMQIERKPGQNTGFSVRCEIAAVPGVDVLLIGTNDLCAEMGIHGDFGNERVADAYRTMIAAARNHSKFPGMAGVYNERRSCRATSRWALVLSWAARTPPSWPPAQPSAPGS
jgi:2-keto-3-deoxy-L-rhamnonate aldolase RhmA